MQEQKEEEDAQKGKHARKTKGEGGCYELPLFASSGRDTSGDVGG